jgi:GntR family transcriptional regulator
MAVNQQFETRPLYLQVRDRLAELIADGTWSPGLPIPNEIQLAHDMGVSIGTMRKALQSLVEGGLVRRQQGRGTQVLDHSLKSETPYDNLRTATFVPLTWNTRILSITTEMPGDVHRQTLALEPGQSVIRLCRLLVDQITETKLLEEIYLPKHLFQGLVDDTKAHEMPTWQMARRYRHLLGAAQEEVRIEPSDQRVSRELGVPVGTPLLHLTTTIFSLFEEPNQLRVAHGLLQGGAQYCNFWNK